LSTTEAEPGVAIVGAGAALATEALAWVLARSGNRVVGSYGSSAELAADIRAGRLHAQAAIVYTDDPEAGPEAVSELKRAHPELKIVLLCERATPAVVRCAIEEQAEGVILTSDTVEEMVLALRHVLEGRAVMPAGWQAATPREDVPLAALSEREHEILELLARGLSNKEIAAHLTISANTVKFHLRTIYAKLGVRNRVQAMRAADRCEGASGADHDRW
jgi:DNA-binding NarL/FixJ family response regulator